MLNLSLLWLLASCNLISGTQSLPDPTAAAAAGQQSPGGSPPPGGNCDLSSGWMVELTTSGGLAGVHQVLSVESDGQASYSDREGGVKTAGMISDGQLAQLSAALESACPHLQTAGRGQVCADCFQHDLVLVSNGTSIRWTGSTESGVQASIEELMVELQAIAEFLQDEGQG